MKKDFNLSKEITEVWVETQPDTEHKPFPEGEVIKAEKVKEFIKKEEKLIEDARDGIISWGEFWIKRKELAGDDLI